MVSDLENNDLVSENETISKKCPICDIGKIVIHELVIEGEGECDNENNHEYPYSFFEIIKLNPLTVKHIQEPLRTYLIPSSMPWVISEKGLRFSVRDSTNHDKIVDAVNQSLEGIFDLARHVLDSLEWEQIDWDDYVEEDDGTAVYVLEDLP
tara:strand:- start:561 stop:1016 length:456 start_codon:yes stop_codon:yes gene_type:complete